jgi:hypothetical protein
MNRTIHLCIGAPKSGTTWLFDNLKNHPGIWTLPYKSTQYFSGISKNIRQKKLKRNWRKILRNLTIPNLSWHLNFFFNPFIGNRWFLSLFKPAKQLPSIDISPSYCALDLKDVQKVREVLGENSKVIFLIRNPIERSWSNAKMTLLRNKKLQPVGMKLEDYIEFFERKKQIDRTSYWKTIQNWENQFGKENLLVLFFDQISKDPYNMLKEICGFLEIDYSSTYFKESAERNIFKGIELEMPNDVRSYLEKKYREEIKFIQLKYASFSMNWQ